MASSLCRWWWLVWLAFAGSVIAAAGTDTEAIRALNAKIVRDARVEMCLVPICDGLTMARKL